MANRIVGGTGDVDSAQLAQRMWLLGRMVAADERLGAAFDEGLDAIAKRTAGTELQSAMASFLTDHGHRGNDEYELATPAWAMDPAPKDIGVLENLGARRVLHELVRRASGRGGPSDPGLGFFVTIDELPDYLAAPATFAEQIAERAARAEYLNQRIPPPWFEARITDPSWTPLFLGAVAVVCDSRAIQSHAAIVARELGIPAVMSAPGITAVSDGTIPHVDGDTGTVTVR